MIRLHDDNPTERLPALWLPGFCFVLQLVNILLAAKGHGGVAGDAHLGGSVAGMALLPLFERRGVRLFQPARRHYE